MGTVTLGPWNTTSPWIHQQCMQRSSNCLQYLVRSYVAYISRAVSYIVATSYYLCLSGNEIHICGTRSPWRHEVIITGRNPKAQRGITAECRHIIIWITTRDERGSVFQAYGHITQIETSGTPSVWCRLKFEITCYLTAYWAFYDAVSSADIY